MKGMTCLRGSKEHAVLDLKLVKDEGRNSGTSSNLLS